MATTNRVIDLARVRKTYGEGDTAVRLAREALERVGDRSPVDEGLASAALADALALTGAVQDANDAYQRAVDVLEEQGFWRDAAQACRGWGRMLRQDGREEQALDVLERAAELGMRAAPADTHAER